MGILEETELQFIVLPGGAPVGAQPVPGILEGIVMGAEIQALVGPEQAEAVHEHLGAVLDVALAEKLLRTLVRRGLDRIDGLLRVVEQHAARLRRVQFMVRRQMRAVHQRVMELTDDGMGLVVLQPGTETDFVRLQGDREGHPHVQFPPMRTEGTVSQGNDPAVRRHLRPLLRAEDLNLLFIRGVVVETPQQRPSGIVLPRLHIAERGERAVRGDGDRHLVVGKGQLPVRMSGRSRE